VLDVAVTQIILDQPGIRALIGQGEAAAVAEHMRVSTQGQASGITIFLQ
jgi:hypothetical protein